MCTEPNKCSDWVKSDKLNCKNNRMPKNYKPFSWLHGPLIRGSTLLPHEFILNFFRLYSGLSQHKLSKTFKYIFMVLRACQTFSLQQISHCCYRQHFSWWSFLSYSFCFLAFKALTTPPKKEASAKVNAKCSKETHYLSKWQVTKALQKLLHLFCLIIWCEGTLGHHIDRSAVRLSRKDAALHHSNNLMEGQYSGS